MSLEPLTATHASALVKAAEDGQLWELWFTAIPHPSEVDDYVSTALEGQRAGQMLPWVVRDLASGIVVGSTRYHDIVAPIDRVEIGYTWYAASWQRTLYVNAACKLLLMTHAFEAIGCRVVGLRTDPVQLPITQQAIERLGAKQDGIIPPSLGPARTGRPATP